MKEAALGGVQYIGVDVVRELVENNRAAHGGPGREFLHGDFVRDPLPRVDVIVCRDVLAHLSCPDVQAALENFGRSGSTWLLTNTFVSRSVNPDIETGGWRPLNLQAPPFDSAARILRNRRTMRAFRRHLVRQAARALAVADRPGPR